MSGPSNERAVDRKQTRGAFELVLPSSSEHLALVRSCVRWFCERIGLCEKETGRTVLCIVEAVTNIIRHAYHGEPDHTIQIRFHEFEDRAEFELVDDGCGVSEEELCPKCPGGDETGGRGVDLIKNCVDEFRYEARPEGGARLVLTKMRPTEESRP